MASAAKPKAESPAAALAEVREEQQVRSQGWDRESLIREFGAKNYHEDDKGGWRVDFRSPRLSQHENDMRGRKFQQGNRGYVKAARERSYRKSAAAQTVEVVHRNGARGHVAAEHEDSAASKGARPGRKCWGRTVWRKTESEYRAELGR